MKTKLLKKLRKNIFLFECRNGFMVDDKQVGSWWNETFKKALSQYHKQMNRIIDANELREAKYVLLLPRNLKKKEK